MPFEMVARAAPVAFDAAADRVVGAVYKVQTLDGIWLQLNLFVARFEGSDAAEVFVFPEDEVAEEHHMVGGVHRRVGGVAVPQLPDGCSAVADHVAPRRVGVVGGDFQCEIAATIVGEGAHQELYADNARRDMAVVKVFCAVNDVFEHVVFVAFGHHPEIKRQDVGGDGVVVVTPRLMVQIMGIISFRRGENLIFEILGIVSKT